jgi:hypothetical protein
MDKDLHFRHKILKDEIIVKKEFKWKVFLFGSLYHAYKGMWKSAIAWFLVALVTGGLGYIIAGFTFHKEYVNHLLRVGYEFIGEGKERKKKVNPLVYILGIPAGILILVLLYNAWEKDRVYRDCVKNINYLGKTEIKRTRTWERNEYIPNCLEVLGK